MKIKLRVNNLIKKYQTSNPFVLCRYLNITVVYADLGNIKGFYKKVITNKYIVLNEELTQDERILVLSHELGHAMLHSTKNIQFSMQHTIFKFHKQEEEADEFARYLLMDYLKYNELRDIRIKQEIFY